MKIRKSNIFIVDSYYGDSHRYWAEQFQKSFHDSSVTIFHLAPRHWKWHMEAGAIQLAEQINSHYTKADIILATDMVNLPLLKSLIGYESIYMVYMHENQISYPWSPNDPDRGTKRDLRYGFINYTSCLIADSIIFNSNFHYSNFFLNLQKFLNRFPKNRLQSTIHVLRNKSTVIPLILDAETLESQSSPLTTTKFSKEIPIIVWPHRWEHDKAPIVFLNALDKLIDENIDFRVIFLGAGFENFFSNNKLLFNRLSEKVIHQGYVSTKTEYFNWLRSAQIVVSCADHEFFGVAVAEAILAGAWPILPNRLAYPELLPSDFHSLLYEKGQFYNSLKAFILSDRWQEPTDDLSAFLRKHFIASSIITKYRCLFNDFLSTDRSISSSP